MVMVTPTSSCLSCGCDLSEVAGFCCPACGARVNAAPSPVWSRLRECVIVVAVMSFSSFMLPVLIFIGAAVSGASDEGQPIAMAIPYSMILARSNLLAPSFAVWLGMLQGPIYGFVMIRKWPPHGHPLAWLALVAIHVTASLAACSCLR